MNAIFKDVLWKNFSASIEMLQNIIVICPDGTWQKEKKIFYMTYHTIIFLDYYLSSSANDFNPDLPYTLCDPEQIPPEAIDDVIPSKLYSKGELLSYITSIRGKCKKNILQTPVEGFSSRWISEDEVNIHGLCPPLVTNYNVFEILLYNLRHVQHHVGQLNLLLRQNDNVATDWISQVD